MRLPYNRVMGTFFRRPRLSLWIACLAILLNALAPSISHALAAHKGSPSRLIEICTVAGTRVVADGDAAMSKPAGSDAQHREALEHCPYCSIHAGSDGLPPPALIVLQPADRGAAMPLLFYAAPRPLFSWSAARPRGPPLA